MNELPTSEKENIINIPNFITLVRGLMMVWSSLSVALGWPSVEAALIYATGAIGDWLDGFAARKLGQKTEFGKKLDPLVDATAFVTGLTALALSLPETHERVLITTTLITQLLYSGQLSRKWKLLSEWEQYHLWPTLVAKTKTAVMMASASILLWWPHFLEDLQTFLYSHDITILSGNLKQFDTSLHIWALAGIWTWLLGTISCWHTYNKKANSILEKQK